MKTDSLRKKEFDKNFLDPQSKTYSNAYASAKVAGYSDAYARAITATNSWYPKTLAEKQKNVQRIVEKSVRVLEKSLEYECDVNEKLDVSLLSLQSNNAKFLVERLDKENFSSKSEIAIKDSDEINIKVIQSDIVKNVLANCNDD